MNKRIINEDEAQQLQAEKLKNISDQIKIKQDEIKAKQKEIVDLQQKQHDIQQGKITEGLKEEVSNKTKIKLDAFEIWHGEKSELIDSLDIISDLSKDEYNRLKKMIDEYNVEVTNITNIVEEAGEAAITTSSIGGTATTQSGAPTTPAIAGNAAYVPSYLGMTSRYGEYKKNKKRKKITKESMDFIDKFLTEAKEDKIDRYEDFPNAAIENKHGKEYVFFKQFNIDSWEEFSKDVKKSWFKGFADNNGDPITKQEAKEYFEKRQNFYIELKQGKK
jgi:hypothetical protein